MRYGQIYALSLLLLSCVDTINIELPPNPGGRLAVSGLVERSSDDYRFLVDVNRTQDLADPTLAVKEESDISLLLNGVETLKLVNGESMIFPIDSFHNLFGETTSESKFNILVRTSNGAVFTSLEQEVLDSPKGSSMTVRYEERSELNDIENIVERGYVKVYVNANLINDIGRKVSLRWDISATYRFPEVPWTDNPFVFINTCYVNVETPINEIDVVNSVEIEGPDIRELEIYEADADHRFASGFYFTMIQKAINNEAASYWQEVKRAIVREGTIFDTPAGQIRSNIIQTEGPPEETVGYFYTAGIDTIRHFVLREESGNQLHLCGFYRVSETCCDCLLIRGSSYEKPHYWIP